MKFKPLFAVCLLAIGYCSKLINNSNNKSDILEAFDQILDTQRNLSIRIIGTEDYLRLVGESVNSSKYSLELLTAEGLNFGRFKISASYVNAIIYKTPQDVLKILAKEKLQFFRLDGYYILLSYTKCNGTDEKKIFDTAWKQQIFNINIICKYNNEIHLNSFVPYKNKSCGNTDSITISKFINNSWSNEIFFPKKFENLYGCKLRVASFYYPPIIMRQTLSDGTYRYYGSEMEILSLLTHAINFTVNHTYYNYFHKGITLENGTFTGILKQVKDNELDLGMGFYFLNFARAKYLSFSQSHYGVSTVIIIPPGRPYTSFEKLFKPFRFNVWICLVMTVTFGVVTIFIVNFQKTSVKNFIFGTSVKTPIMNLFNIFFNGIINKLPSHTFARYILTMFMFFTFIFRTLYQGSLYQFLQADGKKPEMETINDMMKEEFVFYVRDTLEYSVKHMIFYNRTIVVKPDMYATLIPKTLNPSYHGGIIVPVMEVIYSNYINRNNFTLKVLKEYLLDVPIVYYFPKNFHLMDVINAKMGILKAAGLVSMWMDLHLDKRYVNIQKPSSGPRILRMRDLQGGFELFLFGLVASIAFFLLELLSTVKLMKNLRWIFEKL